MYSAIEQAFLNVFQLETLLAIILCAAWGVFVGAIPGLTATMAVALLVPMTFFLSDPVALAAIVTLEACAIFAGDIPTALVRIPGTPSSAAYVDDAYALTRAGRKYESLGTSLVFSVAGGLFGALVLMTLAPLVAKVAFQFSSVEDFWLAVLGLSCAVVVSRGSLLKGALSLLIGLLISTIGMGVHTQPRFTFGTDQLFTGVNFIPAMIGLFGVSEVLRNVLGMDRGSNGARFARTGDVVPPALPGTRATFAGTVRALVLDPLKAVFARPLRLLWRRKLHALRSSGIGSFVGMLPGAGADIGAWISYAVSKRTSRRPEEYGRGSAEGLGDATSANNSALAGAWMPALVLGIPGDSVTAIVIGVLLMKDITPGPRIFENPKQEALVYGIYITFILANLFLVPIGFLAIRLAGWMLQVPRRVLLPLILLFSIVGAYAMAGDYFDIWVMLAMGILGFFLERYGVPLGPVVLGIILGGMLEETFIQNVSKADSPFYFFSRPWAALLGVLTIVVWASPVVLAVLRRKKTSKEPPA